LSVIGFDDIEIAEYLNLTTMHQPLFESGFCGIEVLLQVMARADGEAACQELPVDLALRGSTAPPPIMRR
jgi:DNA-binding LacI/PurR family transcriptional regulator